MARKVIQAEFLGGYQGKSKSNGRLTFQDDRLTYAVFFSNTFEFSNDDIKSIEVDGPAEVEKRVTVGRLLAVGVFAFAMKKAKKEAFVVVTLKDGNEVVFRVVKHTPMELRAQLSQFLARYRTSGLVDASK